MFYVDVFPQSTKGDLNVGAANKLDFLLQLFLTSLRTSIPSTATRRTKLCWCASATATLFPPTGPGSPRRTTSAMYVSHTTQCVRRAWHYHGNGPMVVSFIYLLLDTPLCSPSSTVPATNMRSRAPRTGPVWPLTTWTSRATPETTSAPGWMKSARPATPSTCACAAAGPPCGPSWESWPRSSYWWPSSSSTRRGESPMRSTMVCTGCSFVS